MTLKPTERAQQKWVERRLNAGVLPDDADEYWADNSYYDTACYEALVWLESAKPNICTLEQAWKRCPRPDWLVWCLMWMNPNRKDVEQALKALKIMFQALRRSKRDLNFLGFYEDGDDYQLKEIKDDLKYVEKRFRKRDTTSAALMCRLTNTVVDVFEYAEHMPGAEKIYKKYATIFRRHYPNPWVMK